MSPLTQPSAQALARLTRYRPPSTIYPCLPLARRAAVLVLIFADRGGDLRVVLTLRSPLLRTFAGQVALPGGRADHLEETPVQTARREAYEEIGLPLDDLPSPFVVEVLAELPCSLAKTHLAVRPVIAFLKDTSGKADVEDLLVPRLQKSEVASVFSVPLERFLSTSFGKGEQWYKGEWLTLAGGGRWRAHEFMAPVWEKANLKKYRVWGMTAKIMVDVARIAYDRDPEFEFNEEIGDEAIIRSLFDQGELTGAAKSSGGTVPKKPVDEMEKGNL